MTLHLDGAMWKQAESVVRTWKMVIAIFIQHKKCQNILAFFVLYKDSDDHFPGSDHRFSLFPHSPIQM